MIKFFTFFYLINLPSILFAIVKPCPLYKNLPQMIKGCEGEECGILKYHKAIKDAQIYQKPDKSSMQIGLLKKCDVISNFQPFFKLIKLGQATVHKPIKLGNLPKLETGDELSIVKGHGEGILLACVDLQEFDVDITDGSTITIVINVSWPKTEGWIQLKAPNGTLGYAEDNDFYMGYYGYDPSLLCPSLSIRFW